MENLLEVKNLSKSYDGLEIITDVSFSLGDHEIAAIVGPSGCGKSTILNIVAGLTGDYSGSIVNKAERTGYVFQEDRILTWLTVYDNIKLVRDKEDSNRINDLIARVKLQGFEKFYPDKLSGGMKQRCGIARAFYYGSNLLLMDEPFKSLDVKLRNELLEVLYDLWKEEKVSVLFVTHDIEEALRVAGKIFVMGNMPTFVKKEIILPETDGLRNLKNEVMMGYMNEIMGQLIEE